jgi:bisphosphoglycerate-independent phosphoglycerate mutase (AlkP superfamily)
VASEIENEGWRKHLGFADLPRVEPREAGAILGRISSGHRLTLYAHYATDIAGHRGGMDGARAALERVDLFLGGILEMLPRDHLLLVASDHGNIEDVEAGHTLNPALGLAAGPGCVERTRGMESILDVTPRILEWLRE